MNVSALSEFDLFLYHQGTNYHAYEMLGAHFMEKDGRKGVRFSVWAPHAKSVRVSHALKSPTTLTDFAWGAQTEKRTPFLPSFSMKWAPSIS